MDPTLGAAAGGAAMFDRNPASRGVLVGKTAGAATITFGGTVFRFGDVLHGGAVDQTDITRIRDVLMFEPPDLGKRLVRFFALLILASAIATYGLLGDSVATVIGAMIVAPLMLPIMGLAFGVSIGDRKAIVNSILVGVAGMATAVLVGFVLGLTANAAFDPTTNAQIMARTAPRLVDLFAALATGLAGAFAIGRKDVSDTLPGVAIAISLVPPLTNAGILFSSGHASLALGSLLLFVTNYFAILITGAFVFGLMGYPGASLVPKSVRGRRVGVALIVIMIILIAVPLGLTTRGLAQDSIAENTAADATKAWLEGTDYRYVSATAKDNVLNILVTGQGQLPPLEELQTTLDGRLYGMAVRLNTVPSEQTEFKTATNTT
jgi:uncharacterized hydrophobic protein (TIGR00271 family)